MCSKNCYYFWYIFKLYFLKRIDLKRDFKPTQWLFLFFRKGVSLFLCLFVIHSCKLSNHKSGEATRVRLFYTSQQRWYKLLLGNFSPAYRFLCQSEAYLGPHIPTYFNVRYTFSMRKIEEYVFLGNKVILNLNTWNVIRLKSMCSLAAKAQEKQNPTRSLSTLKKPQQVQISSQSMCVWANVENKIHSISNWDH